MYKYNENTYISLIILTIILSIFTIIANWKLYKKAGKPGWASLVPIYNYVVLLQIAGLNWWYILYIVFGAFVVPFTNVGFAVLYTLVGLYISFATYYNIGKKMKQSGILYGFLGTFFNNLAILILGFSKKIEYDKSIEVNPNGPFAA